jgi:HNH endonuclease
VAISKRLRYEVLRRDNHTCRYCGASAPDVKLTVDHVVPVVLGGTDEPGNLVTACTACNAGKSASAPDAPLVADVSASALRWVEAMTAAHFASRASLRIRRQERERFRDDIWNQWTYRSGIQRVTVELPLGWETSIDQFIDAGINDEDFTEAVRIAMASKAYEPFRYMCGVLWRWVSERQELARQMLDAEMPDGT